MGTGLGDYASLLTGRAEIPYSDIPGLPIATVESHQGSLIYGRRYGVPLLVLAGRLHYYEGYSASEITLSVYIARALGCETYLATNVTGGLNPAYQPGDIVVIRDHIYLLPDHPLRGTNDARLGPRFPDMLHTYDADIRQDLQAYSARQGHTLHEGVYICLQGPSLETPAEYTMCHRLGADLVGMSTIPEIIVARHCGMRCCAISVVSNVCYPLDRLSETTIASVIDVAQQAAPRLKGYIDHVVSLCE